MNKQDLISKIKQLDGVTQDERAYLINLVNTKKKYGLVWEDKPEEVEEQLRENLPVLKEVKEKAIINGEDNPNHILIEGDNLHALTALTFTHEGKIDVIYIDPPYNTGNNDFKYNDTFVDFEDSFRHSKWLSFINKRLRIAHKLLSENGILFFSIDDYEVAQSKLLLDEIFNKSTNPKETNSLGVLVWNLGTGTQAGHFVRSHEYVIAYCKNKKLLDNFKGGEGFIEHSALKKISRKNPASTFKFKRGTRFDAPENLELFDEWGGAEKMKLISGRMLCKNGKLEFDVELEAGYAMKSQMTSFFDGKDTIDSKGQKVVDFYFNSSGILKYKKERSIINPKSLLSEFGSTKTGSEQLINILGSNQFDYPKSLELIKFLIGLYGKESSILDFFAGSGTTLHATMELNAEDGGNRQCILVTNNENNICEEVTYERNKRVIQGYTNAKGVPVEGLKNNNLRYYKSEFVSRDTSLKNKRELTYLATELLCIKEDCYTAFPSKEKWFKAFTSKTAQFIVIYDEVRIEDSFEIIQALHVQKTNDNPVKVYVFSHGQYPYTEDFEEVLPFITLCALPDAIYKAYQNVLPKKKREVVPVLEEDAIGEEENLFNQDAH